MKTILITGGAGFIGSNFIPYFLEQEQEFAVVNLDLLTYAADLEHLKEVTEHPGIVLYREILEIGQQ